MYNSRQPLSRERLEMIAPSIFAEHKHSARSEKFSFVPTIRVVEKLAAEGWLPTAASQQRVRNADRYGYQKHMIRFARFDGVQPMLQVGDSTVEIVLVNAHDGTSRYQLQAGLFRLVCSNGLIIADSTFENIRLKHQGFDPADVLEASYRVIENVPRIKAEVDSLSGVQLSKDEQMLFAESALGLKYEDPSKAPIKPEQLLAVRRMSDQQSDLWHTFNRVQENLIEKGGIRGRTANMRRTRTRGIHGIDENVKLNKALWTLAEGMKRLKTSHAA